MVTLTQEAAVKVREIISEREEEEQVALRLFVKSGGCSGFSYGLGLDHVREDDNVFDIDGVTLLIDPTSARYVQGSEIDYKEALMGGGFAISNPNAIRTCGCGGSFHTHEEEGHSEDCC